MGFTITKIEIRYEHDIVLARQRTRTIARLLGFDNNNQTRISTAVSEISRNAFKYAGGGEVLFILEEKDKQQVFIARIEDNGPGIENIDAVLKGNFKSKTGMGLGIIGAKRLIDYFDIESAKDKGTTVILGMAIQKNAPVVTGRMLADISEQLAKQSPQNPFEEVQRQNQELLIAMNELKERQVQLERLNMELNDTNRGIVALYAELDEKAFNLSKANELKAHFLSNMSHEFKTPLNSILSLSRLLSEKVDGDLTLEQEKQVAYIRKAAEDLSIIVNDLLDLSKIEAGKVTVYPAEFDISNMFSALRGMLKPLLVNPAVNFIIEEPEGVKSMYTDEGKLSQILRNFISNAIKFTEKGEIRVSAELTEDSKKVVFSVEDTGIGIPPEYINLIFEEYTQVDSPLQRKVKGTGLGLPLSKKLAELLGGKLNVESIVGAGSKFQAVIPVVYSEVSEEKMFKMEIPDITRYPVLVIEDDETAIAIYEKYLRSSGIQILAAKNNREARKILSEVTPVAIILDILLKNENGWDLLNELKSNDVTRNIPVFVVTILKESEKGMAMGADDFMTKPIEREWLLNKLNSILSRKPVEKVLVIDDDEVSRYILKGFLADTKYKVLEAVNGRDGIRIAEEEQPGIIFLDLIMPEMDGFEVLKRLKASPKTCDIPVIIVTSKVLEEKEMADLKKNSIAVLSKETTSREAIVLKIRESIAKIVEKKNK